MTSICWTPLRVPKVRATLLDSCGNPVVGSCSTVSSDGIITIEQTAEIEDREDFYVKNGNGDFCVTETVAPILKWINLKITFCMVDPELVNILTAEPLILNDAASPVAVGYRSRQGSAASSFFALEAWTRIAGTSGCSGTAVQYGYALWPFVVQGIVEFGNLENGVANFVVNAKTSPNSLWGVGPYAVLKSEAVATPNYAFPLLSAVTSADHRLMFLTKEPPPLSACGCVALPQAFLVAITKVGLVATLTFPSPATTLPANIDWGDGSAQTLVTSGTTITHTYAAPGTYTVKYWSQAYSAAPWQETVTV